MSVGKRDAFLAPPAYGNLHRESCLADQLIKRVKVHDAGLHVTMATTETDQGGKERGPAPRALTQRPTVRTAAPSAAGGSVVARSAWVC